MLAHRIASGGFHPNRILVKNMGAVFDAFWDGDSLHVLEHSVVSLSSFLPGGNVARQMQQFDPENRSLEAIQPGVDPDHVVVVLLGHAVVGNLSARCSHLLILRDYGTAIPHATEVFGRKKTRGTEEPNGSRLVHLSGVIGPLCTNCLGIVFNDRDVVLFRNRGKCRHIRHLSEKMNGHDCFGPLRDGLFDLACIDGEGVGVNVHQYGFGSQQGNDLHRTDEGKSCRDDFVARANSERHHCNLKGICAVSARNDML